MKIKVNVPNSLILSLEMVGTRRSFQGKKFFSLGRTDEQITHSRSTHSHTKDSLNTTQLQNCYYHHLKEHHTHQISQEEKIRAVWKGESFVCWSNMWGYNVLYEFQEKNLYTFTTSHTRCLACYFLRLLSYTRFLSGWIELVNCIRLHTDVNSRSLHCWRSKWGMVTKRNPTGDMVPPACRVQCSAAVGGRQGRNWLAFAAIPYYVYSRRVKCNNVICKLHNVVPKYM